jgi:hypothetical protein
MPKVLITIIRDSGDTESRKVVETKTMHGARAVRDKLAKVRVPKTLKEK